MELKTRNRNPATQAMDNSLRAAAADGGSLDLRYWDDQASWDTFVASQTTGHFHQGWGWGEIAAPLGSRVVRLAITDGDAIRGATEVVINPLKRTGRSHLHVSRGPVIDSPDINDFRLLVSGLTDIAQEHGGLAVRIEPNVAQGDARWKSLLEETGFQQVAPPTQPRSVWMLDVRPDLDTLMSNMKSKTRYNIRLAERKGVEVVRGERKDISVFYEMYRETAARDAFFIHPRSLYDAVFDVYWALGQFEFLLARFNGEYIAAVTLVHLGDKVWYLYGASRNEHRNVMAPYLLQWHAIQWAKSRGASLYDFRAVPDVAVEGQDMYGVYRFKQGFGGYQFTALETYAYAFRPTLFKLWNTYFEGRHSLQSAIRRIKGLPVKQSA